MTAQSGNSGGNSMQQRMRDAPVLEQKHKTFVMCAGMLAIVPVFCALVVSPGVSALSLPNIVKDITAPVTDILPGKGTSTHPTPASPSSHGDSQQGPAAASNATSSTSSRTTDISQPAANYTPLEPMPTLNQDLEQINLQSQRSIQPAVARSVSTTRNSSFAFLQPSEQGWKIFGAPWYLWGLVIVAIVGVWWWLAVQKARHLISLAFWL